MSDVDVRITLSAVRDGDALRLRNVTTVVLDAATGARAPALVEFSEDGGATWTTAQFRVVVVGFNQDADAVMLHALPKKK